ncbi:uncharacterized protein V6R79_020241 [Siganus canaliculatus]
MGEPVVFRSQSMFNLAESNRGTGSDQLRYQSFKLDSIFKLLEENMLSFVRKELKKMHKLLSPDESQREDEEADDEEQKSSREAFVKITLHFLRRMKQEELADCLQSSKSISTH